MQDQEVFAQIRGRAETAARFIQSRSPVAPEIAVILGSGLDALAAALEPPTFAIPYREIPYFPVPSVSGHPGELIAGHLSGRPVWLLRGRVHLYEGFDPAQTTFPIRVMKVAGVRGLVVTNAAGGLHPAFAPGDLMIIADHLNLVALAGHNPLVGPHDLALGARFPALAEAYDPAWRQIALAAANHLGFPLREGVYAMVGGPSYETPAEARFLRGSGADAVGMSTANEVIVARQAGLRVLGLSCITNVLSEGAAPASHDEVLAAAQRAQPHFVALIQEALRDVRF